MKIIRFIPLLFSFVLFIASCQNEIDDPGTTIALGSLSDASGNCYTTVVAGVYQEDSVLQTSNYIDAAANFTTTGAYTVRTDTINGYYFTGNGTVYNTGNSTIRLNGTGQPIVAGIDTFHMYLNGSSSGCNVLVEVISSTTLPADITLGGNGGSCSGAVLAGNYTSGTAMTTANTVTLNVTVNTPGPYNITTSADNGVSFSGSGMATAGTTSIVLTATGSPAASSTDVTSVYNVTLGTGSCTFNVIYTGVPTGPASFTFDCSTMDPTFPVAGERIRLGQVLDPNIDTITTQVNVITPGTYTIVTTYGLGGSDGVTFSAPGVFTTTGVQTLRLGANGTASRGGIVFYNISSPQSTNPTPCSTSCYYEFLKCSVDVSPYRNFTFLSDVVNDNSSLPGYDLVRWKGFSAATGNESVELTIGLPTGGDFNTTSTDVIYTSNDFPAMHVKAVYTDNSNVAYSAETDGTVQATPFTITITFCTAGRIEGNYSGTVKDNGGAGPGVKTISGTFGLWRL
ncbi:MAG: hypothetical protein QM737_13015 [Ferruginibacter sp.]